MRTISIMSLARFRASRLRSGRLILRPLTPGRHFTTLMRHFVDRRHAPRTTGRIPLPLIDSIPFLRASALMAVIGAFSRTRSRSRSLMTRQLKHPDASPVSHPVAVGALLRLALRPAACRTP